MYWTQVKENLNKRWSTLKPQLWNRWTQLKHAASNPLAKSAWSALQYAVPELQIVDQGLRTIDNLANRYLAPGGGGQQAPMQAQVSPSLAGGGGSDNPFMQ